MDARKLTIALAAGGTAGHINPALALAEELRDRGHNIQFYGQPSRLEGSLVPKAGFNLVPVDVTGFDRSRPWTLASALWRMAKAKATLDRKFNVEGAPDIAVGFGAYVELPLLEWCASHQVPVVLHEQNSVPGLANKTMAKHASAVCISFPAAEQAFRDKVSSPSKIHLTGNPVRRSVLGATRSYGRSSLGIPEDATLLLVFGGSLGAHHINRALAELKQELLAQENLYIVQSTGAQDFDATVENLALSADEQTRWRVQPYIDDMGSALAAADIVVSRAGASSLAEIAALAVPSLLVPYPHATADHQTTNAHFLVDAGAASLIPDSQLDDQSFADELLDLLSNAERRSRMRAAALELGQDKAAIVLADQVESVAGASA